MVEQESQTPVIRIMARTLEKRISLLAGTDQRISEHMSTIMEPGSDWHDIQKLHEDVYVAQEVCRLLGIPEGAKFEIITPREEIYMADIGNTVTIRGEDGEPFSVTIGGQYDFDLDAGVYSSNSPIAQALLGKSKRQSFVLTSSSGHKEKFEILEIEKGKF